MVRVISGLTLTADFGIYESDSTPQLGLDLMHTGSKLFELTPVVTENIGLPYSATSFVGALAIPRCPAVPWCAAN